jgi:ABC transporter with metal-binding/Fe-S-binding domain ATP-binding protein
VFKDIPILMNVASLFSGGKDSIFAIYIAEQCAWNVTNLVTIIPENKESWMYHSVNIDLVDELSKAINIPIKKQETLGEKEVELYDLKKILSKLDIDGVISGALASEYQRTRIEQICYDLEIKSFTPIWHKSQELILNNLIDAGFKIIITGVFSHGLDEKWLGRIIDKECINDLVKLHKKFGINIAGEGGEFETLVVDGPIFEKRLVIDEVSKVWKRDSGTLLVKKSHLIKD